MKITKKDNRYIIEAGRREYELLRKAVDLGAAYVEEYGGYEEEKEIRQLLATMVEEESKF